MKSNSPNTSEDIKPDLKHDSMEFSAATDGDDLLDTDDNSYEEEGITAEELDILDDSTLEETAEALNSAEIDREADEDNLPEEDWLDDLPDNKAAEEDTQRKHPRK